MQTILVLYASVILAALNMPQSSIRSNNYIAIFRLRDDALRMSVLYPQAEMTRPQYNDSNPKRNIPDQDHSSCTMYLFPVYSAHPRT